MVFMLDIAAFIRSFERTAARRATHSRANKPQQQTKIATPTITAKPITPAPTVEVSIEDRHRTAVLDCFYRYYMNKQKGNS